MQRLGRFGGGARSGRAVFAFTVCGFVLAAALVVATSQFSGDANDAAAADGVIAAPDVDRNPILVSLPIEPACAAQGSNLWAARSAYADNCDEPRVDCDPIDGVWVCSSEQIGGSGPFQPWKNTTTTEPNGTTTSGSTPTTTPSSTSPSTTGNDTTSTTTSGTSTSTTGPPGPDTSSCGFVVEAESLALVGDWSVENDSVASNGKYIVWEGLSFQQNNQAPDDTISIQVPISQAGTYRFSWAMRQPDNVLSDRANDSWLNFPDASRFGPTTGGSYGGFVKVYGNATGNFAWRATADVNGQHSIIEVEFDAPGTYTMQIA
ncbi:MAG: hypothetical protein AAFO29_26930, partial [Actinomycetota bacterium]